MLRIDLWLNEAILLVLFTMIDEKEFPIQINSCLFNVIKHLPGKSTPLSIGLVCRANVGNW